MISPAHPIHRGRRAQSTVEFAIVVTVALTLMFGVIQGALALYAYSFVSYAAHSAVRYAMVHGAKSGSPASASSVQSYVQGLAAAIDPSSLVVSTTWTPDNNPGSTVRVQVTYSFQPLTALVWNATLSLSSTAQGLISN